MPFGVIKDYFGKVADVGKSAGDFLIKNYKPILEGVETVSGVLKHVPVIGGVASAVHGGTQLIKNVIEGVQNKEVKEKLKSLENDEDSTAPVKATQPNSGLSALLKPINGGEKVIKYSKEDLGRYTSPAIQHNVLKGEKVPHDIATKRQKYFASLRK